MGYIADGKEVARLTKLLRTAVQSDFRVQVDTGPLTISFWLRSNGSDIAGFILTEQKNCCGIMVSTGTFVGRLFQGQGVAQEMMELKELIAREYGYSMLLATVNQTDNPTECHILDKFGWTLNTSFLNKRTKHVVGIYTKELK